MTNLTPAKLNKVALKESQTKQLVRSKERQAGLGEVFTPTPLVLEMLKKLPQGQVRGVWKDGKTFLDPACGNGQFLAPILIIKKELYHKQPVSTIYGVDIMPDNVKETRERLLKIAGNRPTNRFHLERNIVCADGLKYDYEFDGPYVVIENSSGKNIKICVEIVSDLSDEQKIIKPVALWANNYKELVRHAKYEDWYDKKIECPENCLNWPVDKIIDLKN